MNDFRLRRPDRLQQTFGTLAIDDLIPAGHPARDLERVVAGLDLSGFYQAIRVGTHTAGRSATDPGLLITLWLFACIEGVWSARRLAELCERDNVYRWILGGVSVNHRLLSDFRTGHLPALDRLFTQVLTALMAKGIVSVNRISQDGLKVRASAGSSSFRREPTLAEIQKEAHDHVKQLSELFADAEKSAALSARQKAMRRRAAKERAGRVEEALALVGELQKQQEESAKNKSRKQREKENPVRASTSDPDAKRMKMSDGGTRPAFNVQLAADTASRAIVGVFVTGTGTDYDQDLRMRKEIRDRLPDSQIRQHLVDGGYTKIESVNAAHAEGVELFAPPKPPKNKEKFGDEYQPRPQDSEAMRQLRRRMGEQEGKEIFKQRAATSETINADLRCRRGLREVTVRGIEKLSCVVLFSALAYNLMHFGRSLLE